MSGVLPDDDEVFATVLWFLYATDRGGARHQRGLTRRELRELVHVDTSYEHLPQRYGALEQYFYAHDPAAAELDRRYAAVQRRRRALPWWPWRVKPLFLYATLFITTTLLLRPDVLWMAAVYATAESWRTRSGADITQLFAAAAVVAWLLGPVGLQLVAGSLGGGLLLWFFAGLAPTPGRQYARERAWLCVLTRQCGHWPRLQEKDPSTTDAGATEPRHPQ